jgi:hypothetical protein
MPEPSLAGEDEARKAEANPAAEPTAEATTTVDEDQSAPAADAADLVHASEEE